MSQERQSLSAKPLSEIDIVILNQNVQFLPDEKAVETAVPGGALIKLVFGFQSILK